MPKQKLQPDVAAKYDVKENFLYGQKLVFPSKDHGVANKPAHELTVQEVDALIAAGVAKGIFTLKEVKPAAKAPKPEAEKP